MYTIRYETHFAAAHQLHGYNGECSEIHGHTWRVRVEIQAHKTDEIGISFDFKQLKALTNKVVDRLDHNYINGIPPFDKENPTAENLARYCYTEVSGVLPDFVTMARVTVWESDQYAVTYEE